MELLRPLQAIGLWTLGRTGHGGVGSGWACFREGFKAYFTVERQLCAGVQACIYACTSDAPSLILPYHLNAKMLKHECSTAF